MLSLSLVAASTLFAGARAQITPNNLVPASTSGSLSALKYTHVGGTGSYMQVTDIIPGEWPSCTVNPSCIQQEKQISGNLAPFDEEMTIVFQGPMNIHNIAVYQPANTSAATWKQTSSFTSGQAPTNLVFMNNDGGGASGEWSICAGASQSYANGTWNGAAASANEQVYNGFLDENSQINIMTAETCQDSPCDGFSRGTANHGWGDSKMFVMTFDMPPSSTPSKTPAIWGLNAQVVRSAQYGCNCRGMGSPGGCGELDILENLNAAGANPDQGVSEVYSFKGATGSGNNNFFARPLDSVVTYAVILDVQTDQILIQRLSDWDYTQTAVTRSIIDGYLNSPSMLVSFDTNTRRSERPRSFMGAHRRRHGH